MLGELRDMTAVGVVSVREEAHRCPNVMWVTFPILLQTLYHEEHEVLEEKPNSGYNTRRRIQNPSCPSW